MTLLIIKRVCGRGQRKEKIGKRDGKKGEKRR
jgi:hypothetical protein